MWSSSNMEERLSSSLHKGTYMIFCISCHLFCLKKGLPKSAESSGKIEISLFWCRAKEFRRLYKLCMIVECRIEIINVFYIVYTCIVERLIHLVDTLASALAARRSRGALAYWLAFTFSPSQGSRCEKAYPSCNSPFKFVESYINICM